MKNSSFSTKTTFFSFPSIQVRHGSIYQVWLAVQEDCISVLDYATLVSSLDTTMICSVARNAEWKYVLTSHQFTRTITSVSDVFNRQVAPFQHPKKATSLTCLFEKWQIARINFPWCVLCVSFQKALNVYDYKTVVTFGGFKDDFMLSVNKVDPKTGKASGQTERLIYSMAKAKVIFILLLKCPQFLFSLLCQFLAKLEMHSGWHKTSRNA